MRLFVLAVTLTGCVVPIAIPPLRGEVGGATLIGQHTPALHVAGGASVASGTVNRDQKFDLGLGGFVDLTQRATSVRGIYVETSMFIDPGELSRTSVGLRGELRLADGLAGSGAKLRIDHEIFSSATKEFVTDDHCGTMVGRYHGTAAIGLYGEAGRVWQPDGVAAWMATAGITVRIPAALGIAVIIPGCK